MKKGKLKVEVGDLLIRVYNGRIYLGFVAGVRSTPLKDPQVNQADHVYDIVWSPKPSRTDKHNIASNIMYLPWLYDYQLKSLLCSDTKVQCKKNNDYV